MYIEYIDLSFLMFYLCIHEYYNGKKMDVFYALPLGASHRTFAMILIEKTRMVVFDT